MLFPRLFAARDLTSRDGPDWTGAHRSSVYRAEGGAVVRKVRVVLGHSNVVVGGDRLHAFGHDPETQPDRILRLDAATEVERRRHEFPAATMGCFPTGGIQTAPTLTGGRAFVRNREGGTFWLDAIGDEERPRVREVGMSTVETAGERLLSLPSKRGLIVAEAPPEGPRELFRQRVLEQDEGVRWTFPVRGRVNRRGSEGNPVCVEDE